MGNFYLKEVEDRGPEMVVPDKLNTSSNKDTSEEGGGATVVFFFSSIGHNTILHSFVDLGVKRVSAMAQALLANIFGVFDFHGII